LDTFHSGNSSWGADYTNIFGGAVMDVDELFSGNYLLHDIASGIITIRESSKGYKIEYEVVTTDGDIIKGQYEGDVIKL